MILTDSNRKFVANAIDDAIKAKGVLELVDGFAARVLLNVVDNYIDSKLSISDSIKNQLNALVEAAKENDIESLEIIAADLLNSIIDIPGIDEEGEKLIFEGAVKIIVGALKTLLGKS